ncbi:MAG: GTPase, partial [Cyanobacteria bacterium P01_H01_bin.105]
MNQDDLRQFIDQVLAEGWTELNLSDQNLSDLPSEIGKLTQLEVLILGYGDDYFSSMGNRIKKLPPEIVHLIHLKKLYFIGNKLSTMPLEIVQLPQLQRLDLSA